MKKIIFIFLLAALCVGLWLFHPHKTPVHTDGKLQVVSSGYVPYTLAKQLAGRQADVSMLLPPNAEPHSCEPTPGALVAVRQADLFVYVSDSLEPWARDIVSGAGSSSRVVRLADFAAPSPDPHIWMSFTNMAHMAQGLSSALAEKDPAHADVYQANLQQMQAELTRLQTAYQTELAHCQSRQLVHIGHLAFGLLAKEYQLSLSALAGSSHDGEHSARRLADLIVLIKQNHVPAIFTEPTLSPRLAATVSQETGVQVLPLYTVESVSKADFEQGVTYAELMRRNLENLKRGLKCQA